MGAKTGIEWTDSTWNPIRGTKGNWHCSHVSEGCRNCYAERFNVRLGGPAYKAGADMFRLDEKALSQPLRWRAPRKIFVCSMTDLFHESLDAAMIGRVLNIIGQRPDHIFQIVTKRPARMRDILTHYYRLFTPARGPYPNLWAGVSVEDQATVNERIPILLETPARIRWISAEPLLGPIYIKRFFGPQSLTIAPSRAVNGGLNWVVAGGESGAGARPCHADWIRLLRDQCEQTGVAFFFKQWGEWSPYVDVVNETSRRIERTHLGVGAMSRVGKKKAGRDLDGATWHQFPS